MTPSLKELALAIQAYDPNGKITIALTPERILQYRDEVLGEAIQVVENWHFDRRPGNLRKLHETLCSLKSKEPSP